MFKNRGVRRFLAIGNASTPYHIAPHAHLHNRLLAEALCKHILLSIFKCFQTCGSKIRMCGFFFYCMPYRNELKLIVGMAVHSQRNVVVSQPNVIQYPFEFLMFVFVSESYVSIRLCLWKSRQHPWQIGSRECLCLVTIIHRLKLPKIVRAS